MCIGRLFYSFREASRTTHILFHGNNLENTILFGKISQIVRCTISGMIINNDNLV